MTYSTNLSFVHSNVRSSGDGGRLDGKQGQLHAGGLTGVAYDAGKIVWPCQGIDGWIEDSA